MTPQRYPTDLTDGEWAILEPRIPPAKAGGRPRGADAREVLDAVRCLLRSGGAWRLLPREFPPWPTVYACFQRWQADGTWERIAGALRRDLRAALRRRPEPSAAALDSLTVKASEKGDPAATTRGRRRPAASGTSSSAPRAS